MHFCMLADDFLDAQYIIVYRCLVLYRDASDHSMALVLDHLDDTDGDAGEHGENWGLQ